MSCPFVKRKKTKKKYIEKIKMKRKEKINFEKKKKTKKKYIEKIKM